MLRHLRSAVISLLTPHSSLHIKTLHTPHSTLKIKIYEYRNEKEHLEADNSAHRINRYGDSNHIGRYKLHGVG